MGKAQRVVPGTRVSFSHVNICSEVNPGTCRWGNVTPFYAELTEVGKTVINSAFEPCVAAEASTASREKGLKNQRNENCASGLKEVSYHPSVHASGLKNW